MTRTKPSPALLLLATLPFTTADAQRPSTARDAQTIVFVCEHGTVKSVLAMAWFQKMAQSQHLPYKAVSRGTAPETAVPRMIRDSLRRDGITLGPFTPTKFSMQDVLAATMVVSFDQPVVAEIVAGRVPTAAWNDIPAVSQNYDAARDAIKLRVAILVDSLAKAAAKRR